MRSIMFSDYKIKDLGSCYSLLGNVDARWKLAKFTSLKNNLKIFIQMRILTLFEFLIKLKANPDYICIEIRKVS